MDNHNLTELQQAERTAKEWAELDPHGNGVRTLARVFLAQQARLAEVERERDGWRRSTYNLGTSNADLCKRITAAESRLASARVEGAREFVARYVSANVSPDMTDRFFHYLRDLERFRDREYPAPAAPRPEPSSGQRDKLRAAALALYEKDMWVCEGVPEEEQVRLWENLRDALGLPAGHATELGVGAAPAAPAGEPTRPAPTPEPEPQNVAWSYAGYRREVLSDATGRILGSVVQGRHEATAYGEHGVIGQYISLNLAKKAVVVALASRPTQTAEG